MPTLPWRWELSSRASADLREIVIWTYSNFGQSQANTYRATIYASLRALKKGPTLLGVRARDSIAPDLLVLHIAREGRRGRHFLVFRVTSARERRIEVLRILHDQMDITQHIPPTE